MFYCLYKITNTINGKIYVGVHKTQDLNDSYMGSGKLILAAIKKYGKSSFFKEIIGLYKTEEEMISKEIEIVTEEFCDREDTYNLMPGGKFGSTKRNGLTFKGRSHSETSKKSISEKMLGRQMSEESKLAMSRNNFARRDPARQKEHASKISSGPKTEEHKRKISESLKDKKRVGWINPTIGKQKPKITCPYCQKEGAVHVMYRWHFDNCKNLALKSTGSDTTL